MVAHLGVTVGVAVDAHLIVVAPCHRHCHQCCVVVAVITVAHSLWRKLAPGTPSYSGGGGLVLAVSRAEVVCPDGGDAGGKHGVERVPRNKQV